jgi:hypothetical protein
MTDRSSPAGHEQAERLLRDWQHAWDHGQFDFDAFRRELEPILLAVLPPVEPPQEELDNHHNALTCPHCNPKQNLVETFPCQECGEPIFLPHLRCQSCICRQRDALRSSLDAALLEQQRLTEEIEKQREYYDEKFRVARITLFNANDEARELTAKVAAAESKLAILSSSLEGIAGELEPLLRETWTAHRDKDSSEYNECEEAECTWCSETRAAIAKLRTLLSSITQQTGNTEKSKS